MYTFNGNCVLAADTPATPQEMIMAAIALRTYSAVPATNTRLIAEEQSRWRAAVVNELFIRPVDGDILMINAYRNVQNGVVDQSAYDAADFADGETLVVTQSKTLSSGGEGNQVSLSSRIFYAAAETIVNLDATIL